MHQPLAYSIKNAAAVCGIGRTKLYELIKAGEIRSRKIGSRTVVLRSDLESMLARAANAG